MQYNLAISGYELDVISYGLHEILINSEDEDDLSDHEIERHETAFDMIKFIDKIRGDNFSAQI